jgi:hypothetical protein
MPSLTTRLRKACIELAQRTVLTLLDRTAISVTAITSHAARSLSAAPPAATADDEDRWLCHCRNRMIIVCNLHKTKWAQSKQFL